MSQRQKSVSHGGDSIQEQTEVGTEQETGVTQTSGPPTTGVSLGCDLHTCSPASSAPPAATSATT